MTQEPWSREDMAVFLSVHDIEGEPNRIMDAGSWAESGRVVDARGDLRSDGFYCSRGFWQINLCGGAGTGLGPEIRMIGLAPESLDDPNVQVRIMAPIYRQHYEYWKAQGMTDEELCWRTCCWAEKPYDYTNRDSHAAQGYRAGWIEAQPVEVQMAFDPELPRVVQTNTWECSVASATWMLRSSGHDVTLSGMRASMVAANLVTPEKGLLYGSGAPLAEWLGRKFGADVRSQSPVSFEWVQERAGNVPMMIGGHNWYHWVGVRGLNEDGSIRIANPAEGHKGIWDRLTEYDIAHLGAFAAVWIELPEEGEDEGMIAELQAEVARLTEDNARLAQEVRDVRSASGALGHDVIKPTVEQLEAEASKPSARRKWAPLARQIVERLREYVIED